MRENSTYRPGAVALVTGTSRGIGRGLAEALLDAGLKVICTARNKAPLEEIFASYGANALPISLDVTDGEQMSGLIEGLPADFAEIDIAIASAGSDVGGRRRFDQGDIEDWASTIDTNVCGLMRTCYAVIPGMLARGRGHVVTLGSIAGLRTYEGGTVYGPSKFAVRAFTDALRLDYKHDPIRITEILPGLVRTGFAEARHHGSSEAGDAYYEAAAGILTPDAIVEATLYALQQPDSVNVAQIVVTPTADK